jgi:hypothetical protein
MSLSDQDESLILRGRRQIPDENGDDYFQYVAAALKQSDGKNVFGVVKSAVAMFGTRSKCAGCG